MKLPLELKLEIARLLGEGWCISDVARQVKKSAGSIAYQAQLLVEDGRLERISERPAHYKITNPKSFQVGGSAISSDAIPQTCIYKKFGASFALIGRPALPYREDGKARIETAAYIVEFGRYKAKIWLKAFVGKTLNEQKENGESTLRSLAAHYASKYKVSLSFLRLYEEREVLVASVSESSKLAKGIGLAWGEQKPVDGALHKAGDSSDPHNYQMNVQSRPELHGKRLERLYSGEYERVLERVIEATEKHSELDERFSKNLELHLSVLQEIRDAIRKLKEGKHD